MFPKEAEFFEEVLSRFGIESPDEFDIVKHQKSLRIKKICKDIVDKIDLNKLIKPK